MTEEIIKWFYEWGSWAIILSMLLSVIMNILGFIPSIVITGANVVVWGPLWGGLLSWISEVIGSSLAFLLYRYGKKKWSVTKEIHWKWIRTFDEWSRAKQFTSLLLARIMPIIPSGLINVLGALTQIYILDFAIATALGKIPSNLLEVLISYGLLQVTQSELNWILLIIGAVICCFLFWKRGENRFNDQE